MSNKKKAVIIGAGIAGLAAAIRLRLQGFNTCVYEAAAGPGGKIGERRWNNFRFDTGPSLFTLPHLVDELFAISGKDPREYFSYSRLQLVTRYFYGDGLQLNAWSDPKHFAREIKEKTSVPAEKVISFLENQKESYNKIGHVFLENPIHIVSRLLRLGNIPSLVHLSRVNMFRSMHSVNENYFKSDPVIKLFDRYATYNGSNPYRMPALFNIISHLEHNLGAFLPSKGMYEIVNALYKLAVETGVDFNFNSYISEIVLNDRQVKAVRVKGKEISTDVVISNMDAYYTYYKLLPALKPPVNYLEGTKSTSALIFQWAMDRSYPQLDVHNVLFANDYQAEFDHLFQKKELFHDPTIYIYISSKAVKDDAPEGKENWFVMINTPHLNTGIDWEKEKHRMREIIIKKIERFLNATIAPHILHEFSTTPEDISTNTFTYLGALYGNASNKMMAAFLRHPNFSKVKGLYFCGGTVHPGGGIPLCLLSAKITANLIKERAHDQA